MRGFFVLCILFTAFSCRSTSRLSDREVKSESASVSDWRVKDSLEKTLDSVGFDAKEWNVVWVHTLYGDSGCSTSVKEKESVTLTARAVARQITMLNNRSARETLYRHDDRAYAEMDDHENVEKEASWAFSNLFWILLVLLFAGVSFRMLKSKN